MIIKIEIPDKLTDAAKRTFGYKEMITIEDVETPNEVSIEEHLQQWVENFIYGEMKTNIRAHEERKLDTVVSAIISKEDIKNPERIKG